MIASQRGAVGDVVLHWLDWSPLVGPMANWALDPCLDWGRPAILLADGPPSRNAIKRKVGARAQGTRFTVAASTPPRFLAQVQSRRARYKRWNVHTAFTVATGPRLRCCYRRRPRGRLHDFPYTNTSLWRHGCDYALGGTSISSLSKLNFTR